MAVPFVLHWLIPTWSASGRVGSCESAMLRSVLLVVFGVCLIAGIWCCENWTETCVSVSTNSCKIAQEMNERSKDQLPHVRAQQFGECNEARSGRTSWSDEVIQGCFGLRQLSIWDPSLAYIAFKCHLRSCLTILLPFHSSYWRYSSEVI
jgi:hypothetical protein